MLGFWAYAVAATMTAVAVWRLPAVLYGDSHRRALWGCYVGFAAALWLKSPAVAKWLNDSPITDISILLKHYVSTAALLAILTYVVASYGKTDEEVIPRHVAVARWIERVAWKAAIGQLALMTVLFFTVVNRSHPSTDFVADHAGQWGASLYESIFYIYLGASSAVTCYQWSSAARRAETRLLRAGLLLMAVAMALGVAYVVIRTAFMWVAVFHHLSHSFDTALGRDTEALQIVLFFLFAAGVSIPTTNAAATRWRSWRALWRLYPLWNDLMTAFPGTAFQPPAGRWREAARISPPLDVRLDRCTQDIADAVDQLRHYAPPTLLFAAEDAAASTPDPGPAAEALWIRAALHALAAGERSDVPSPALPSKPISDSDAEASWLVRVQDAYTAVDAGQVGQLREAAQEYAL
ncbi:hypothetical protein P3T36_000279 [Kitasatospora sp. MAP12-15]|uniref:MAB_1171c family putative transporter n=1 Tax=unclassified Kitasatospora TaxID=2633591 RepID=UPI0024731EDA|nr:MAB_1171c family putative transporter [Kitasatospora sp. MAP12-44]MDH6109508.1 hypothetical protein [Kitasatospora sp. MAP12-44]